MFFRAEPRHTCETPLIQGSPAGHTWVCPCGQEWTVRHTIGEYGGRLGWTRDTAGRRWAAIFRTRPAAA